MITRQSYSLLTVLLAGIGGLAILGLLALFAKPVWLMAQYQLGGKIRTVVLPSGSCFEVDDKVSPEIQYYHFDFERPLLSLLVTDLPRMSGDVSMEIEIDPVDSWRTLKFSVTDIGQPAMQTRSQSDPEICGLVDLSYGEGAKVQPNTRGCFTDAEVTWQHFVYLSRAGDPMHITCEPEEAGVDDVWCTADIFYRDAIVQMSMSETDPQDMVALEGLLRNVIENKFAFYPGCLRQ